MKWLILFLALILGAIGLWSATGPSPAHAGSAATTEAASQTATFAIENMTCALCPVTVRKAMESVRGVVSVSIDFEAKAATVVFDPAVTRAEAISAAATNAGYPASVRR